MTVDPAALLERLWNAGSPAINGDEAAKIPREHREAIDRLINDNTVFLGFRYILPSQLLAKAADPSRHTLALQKGSTLSGSFDARTGCNNTIVPFDRENEMVLGGSIDPLVGNLARYPQMDQHWLEVGRRATQGGTQLVDVLTYAQEHPGSVETLLLLTLQSIAKRLANTRITYPRPNRIALSGCEDLIANYLTARTGGRRLQAVAAALFDTLGERLHLYHSVEVGHINKADASKGDVADLDCRDAAGKTVLSVEVKDRPVGARQMEDTLRVARDRGVAEILFLIRGGLDVNDLDAITQMQSRQFTSGHNLYHFEFEALLHPCLILVGEKGRSTFLEHIGRRIDALGELKDRQAWQKLLEKL